jgi:hypothetical protein
MGMVVIPIAVIYIVISLLVLRFAYAAVGTVKGKCFALLAALVLVLWYPVINPLLSYYSFLSYAREHAKTKIFKAAVNVKSVAVKNPFPENIAIYERHKTQSEKFADKRKYYEFIEYILSDGSIDAAYSDGTHKKYSKQKSNYRVRYYMETSNETYTVYVAEISEANGDVMATSRLVLWHGGHWMRMATDAPTPIYKTLPEDIDYAKFVQSVLRPYQLN